MAKWCNILSVKRRPGNLKISIAASAAMAFICMPASAQEDEDELVNSCRSFSDLGEKYMWWQDQYGEIVAPILGPLYMEGSADKELVWQIFASREIMLSDKADLKRALAIELEMVMRIRELLNDDFPVFNAFSIDLFNKLDVAPEDFRKATICAFECPTGEKDSVGDEYRERVRNE
ncbi:MAG: hypothetical protein AAF667_08890 [Pseudomonadota bacterium]